MRSRVIVAIAAFAFGCGSSEETNNINNTNNVNNTNNLNNTNNQVDMGADEGADDGPDLLDLVDCRVTTWSPVTIAASEGGNVLIDFVCEGVTELVTLQGPEGGTSVPVILDPTTDGTATGQFDVAIEAGVYAVSGHDLTFEDQLEEWATIRWTPSVVNVRLHKTPLEAIKVYATLTFDAAPPQPDAALAGHYIADVDNDGELDTIVAWRYGTTLAFVVGLGSGSGDFVYGAPKTIDVGIGVGPNEMVTFARRGGTTDHTRLAAYWLGLDSGSVHATIVPVDNGILGSESNSSSKGAVYPVIEWGVPLLVEINGNVDETLEMLILFRGNDVDGTPIFGTLRTDSMNDTMLVHSTMATMAGATPAQHAAGDVTISLINGWAQGTANRLASINGAVFGPTGRAGEDELNVVLLTGRSAGMSIGTRPVPGIEPDEIDFWGSRVDIDGDGLLDVVLMSSKSAGQRGELGRYPTHAHAPLIRTWKTEPNGGVGPTMKRYSAPNISLSSTLRSDQDLLPPRVPLTTSVQSPYKLEYLQSAGIMATHAFGGVFDIELGDQSLAAEVIWTPESVDPLVVPLPLSTRDAVNGFAAYDPVYSAATPAGALRIAMGDTSNQARVLVAGNTTNNTEVYIGAGATGLLLTDTGGEHEVSWGTNALFDDPEGQRTFMARVNKGSNDFATMPTHSWTFHIWDWGTNMMSGPATIALNPRWDAVELMSAIGSTLWFTNNDNGEFVVFTLTMDELAQAAADRATLTITDQDVTTYGPMPPSNPIRPHQKGLRYQATPQGDRIRASLVKNIPVAKPIANRTDTLVVLADTNPDTADLCPFSTVLFPGDPATEAAIVLAESTQDGCWDLPQPVAMGDFLGTGGQQVITVAAIDTANRTAWTWEYLLWTTTQDSIVATRFGETIAVPGEDGRPTVRFGDFNGDGLHDLAIQALEPGQRRYPHFKLLDPRRVFSSDGQGGALADVGTLPLIGTDGRAIRADATMGHTGGVDVVADHIEGLFSVPGLKPQAF